MKHDGIEIAKLRWGDLPDGTDTSWISLIELPNQDLLIVQYDMGPETLAGYGSFDFEHYLQITSADRTLFTAMLLALTFEGAPPSHWDDLKIHCGNWGIPYKESQRAID